jgi:hypothetical protein
MAHISFLAYKLTSMTDDQITVGLLYADEENYVTPFISDERLKILKKVAPLNVYKHFCNYIKALQRNKIMLADLEYLSVYQNGFIKIAKPGPTSADLAQAKKIFELHIDKNYKEYGN